MAKKKDQPLPTGEVTPALPISSFSWADLILDIGRQWAVMVGGVIGLSYVVGYLVVNEYMSSVGVRPPNLIASRYLATGLLYLLTTVLPLIPFFLIFRGINKPLTPTSIWERVPRNLGRFATAFLFTLAIIIALANTLSTNPHVRFTTPFTMEFYVIAIGLLANTIIWLIVAGNLPQSSGKSASDKKGQFGWFDQNALLVVGMTAPIMTIVIFAVLAYPFANPAFGGGAASPVQLLLDTNAAIVHHLPMADEHEGLTETLDLVEQNDDGYILRLTDKQVIVVPHDEVRGVIIPPKK